MLAFASIIAVAICVACSPTEAPKEGIAVSEDVASAVPSDPDSGPVRAGPAAPSPADGAATKIHGNAVAAGDGAQGAQMPLSMSWGEDGRVAGSMNVGGADRRISGMVDGDLLRCWITGTDPAGGVMRGTLVGKVGADGACAGDFAVSDSGAASVVRGTWSATR
jgi:hypothetical protein